LPGALSNVSNSTFNSAQLAGSSANPNLPSDYAPVVSTPIGNNVYVTYAQPNAQGGENVGSWLGWFDQFDQMASAGPGDRGGNLNAPWGMALAPAGFGAFGSAATCWWATLRRWRPSMPTIRSFALKDISQMRPVAFPSQIRCCGIVSAAGTTTKGHSGDGGRSQYALLTSPPY